MEVLACASADGRTVVCCLTLARLGTDWRGATWDWSTTYAAADQYPPSFPQPTLFSPSLPSLSFISLTALILPVLMSFSALRVLFLPLIPYTLHLQFSLFSFLPFLLFTSSLLHHSLTSLPIPPIQFAYTVFSLFPFFLSFPSLALFP